MVCWQSDGIRRKTADIGRLSDDDFCVACKE